jgi:hypothetical protein
MSASCTPPDALPHEVGGGGPLPIVDEPLQPIEAIANNKIVPIDFTRES